ncbi:MAG: serpin family protein [Phycisphaerae bacterium]|nr:serpin family protein [Phycisphaerae bacterium]
MNAWTQKRSLAGRVVAMLPVAICAAHLSSASAQTTAPAADELSAVVAGNTEFALALYAQLQSEEGNLLLSPYSISTALAMTYAGARGETAAQMARTLRFSLPAEALHPAISNLTSTVAETAKGKPNVLHIVNSLWGQEGEEFLESFLALTGARYGAGFRAVDFRRAPEHARKTINAWIAEKTRQRIPDLLSPGDVTGETCLVLANAIYFKGLWAVTFDPRQTTEAPFTTDRNVKVGVPMMRQTGTFRLASTDDLHLLDLPYENDELSMVVLLPKRADGLPALMRSFGRENLDRMLAQMRPQLVQLSLPRFKLDTRVELAEPLMAMGMPDAFRDAKADFSGITGKRNLWITAVVHQAQVEVNEKGTEAAAATAVVMGRAIASPVTFLADHPFIFLVRHRSTGTILFLGRVANPIA